MDNLVELRRLTHCFPLGRKMTLKAVDDLSLTIGRGEIFGLVGESGSGKSTVARCVMNLYKPTRGTVLYKGTDTWDPGLSRVQKRMLRSQRQMVFQDSASSLNDRMKIWQIVTEPLAIMHRRPPRGSLREEAEFQLRYVGLDSSCLDRYPSQLSGGMRQRAAIARALSMEPELLVADEPVAALDVSIQAQILNLLKHCNREHHCSMLFIAHDLSVVRYLCDRVGVMYRGRLVELAPKEELFRNPLHPYTQALLSAIPIPDPRKERERVITLFDESRLESSGILQEVSPGHLVLKGGGCP